MALAVTGFAPGPDPMGSESCVSIDCTADVTLIYEGGNGAPLSGVRG